jgi:mannose-6-phosphate isomerase-like protein (cupin superfamily)
VYLCFSEKKKKKNEKKRNEQQARKREKENKKEKEERVWGEFYNLFSNNFLKLKELIIAPGKGMSFQRHFLRNEIWFISKGKCSVNFSKKDPDNFEEISLNTEDTFADKPYFVSQEMPLKAHAFSRSNN